MSNKLIKEYNDIVGNNFKREEFHSTKNNDHEHCEFCGFKITDLTVTEEHTAYGYVTLSKYKYKNKIKGIVKSSIFSGSVVKGRYSYQTKWICDRCLEEYKDKLDLKVVEDIRLIGNFDEIVGNQFERKKYQSRLNERFNNCIFCLEVITDKNTDVNHVDYGYVNDKEQWICEKCFNDFKNKYELKQINVETDKEYNLIKKRLNEFIRRVIHK